jgi:hypothetical protein
MRSTTMTVGLALLLPLALALPARAIDGGFAASGEDVSYYEVTADPEALAAATKDGAAAGGLPTSLYAVDAAGGVQYQALGDGAWQVSIEVASRPHERVDAVYDLVLALPLPVGSTAADWRIHPKTASGANASPVSYGGETIVLKRNVPLETAWLPLLAGAEAGLPDLSRSGYAWTLWDTIVRYDPTAGTTLGASATFRYAADRAPALDPENPDNAAYVITWIPTLEDVAPFAIRLDVVEAAEE